MGCDIHGVFESSWDGEHFYFEGLIPSDRNYRLFAALANVRNGYGFAGIPTHLPIEPISEPRGFPESKKIIEDGYYPYGKYHDAPVHWLGDHSFTWLSIEELVNWKGWDQELYERGMLSREEFEQWTPGTVPEDGWSGDVWGGNVIAASHVDDYYPEGWTHIDVSWSRPLRESCEIFLAWLNYANVSSPKGRIIIGFDS